MSRSKAYADLQKVWYDKLKEEGFEDIETPEHMLKRWHAYDFSRRKSIPWQIKANYYNNTERFLIEHRFTNRREKVIWEYHSKAISIRDIVELLKDVGIKTNRDAVWEIIHRLETLMRKKYMRYDNE